MQYANIEVAIGGNRGNTVPKYNVPASEIAVLRQIHGPDAVFNVEPVKASGDKIDSREELQRLREAYGGAHNEERERHVDLVYPLGAGTKVVTSLADLDLPEESMKPKTRASVTDQVAVRAPRAPGTSARPTEVGDRSQEGDAMTLPIPPGELANRVDTSALGTAGVETDDFLK